MHCPYDSKGNSVPTKLLLMQERLYSNGGLEAEGIFRINPESKEGNIVRDQLNRGIVPKDIDVHCLAGLIKGGCDRQAEWWQRVGNQSATVAMHGAPSKELAWISEMNLLLRGSWDKTLKYWDLRQQAPVHTQQLPERCYAMTMTYPLMIVGTTDMNLIVYNLQSPQNEFKRITAHLKYQTRCLAAFQDQQGFRVGSIEGRVGAHHIDDEYNKRKDRRIGPCEIIQNINDNVYRLMLSSNIRTSDVFNVEHLTRYVGELGAWSVDSRASPFQPGESDAGASVRIIRRMLEDNEGQIDKDGLERGFEI